MYPELGFASRDNSPIILQGEMSYLASRETGVEMPPRKRKAKKKKATDRDRERTEDERQRCPQI